MGSRVDAPGASGMTWGAPDPAHGLPRAASISKGSPTAPGISSSILDAEEGAIRITDRKISALADLLPIFEKPPQQVT
jgi:hypothetical protein